MGVNQYLGKAYQTESWKAQYTAEEIAMMADLPVWITAAFAIAVFAGAIGCLALLIRKKWAHGLLVLSLIAVIVQMGYMIAQGMVNNMGMTIAIIVVALLLVWLSKKSKSTGWIS
jgi:peptidoglycan/LPS O-acetylase OafA/YrhL